MQHMFETMGFWGGSLVCLLIAMKLLLLIMVIFGGEPEENERG